MHPNTGEALAFALILYVTIDSLYRLSVRPEGETYRQRVYRGLALNAVGLVGFGLILVMGVAACGPWLPLEHSQPGQLDYAATR